MLICICFLHLVEFLRVTSYIDSLLLLLLKYCSLVYMAVPQFIPSPMTDSWAIPIIWLV